MRRLLVWMAAVVLGVASTAPAQTSEQHVRDKLKPLPDSTLELFGEDGELASSSAAARLIRDTIGGLPGVDIQDEDWYCIIHVAQWEFNETNLADAKYKQITQALKSQHWYVFRGGKHPLAGEEFSAGRRLWGTTNVWLMYVHLNSRLKDRYTPDYLVKLTKKLPANIDALKGILGVYGIGAQEPGVQAVKEKYNLWGAEPLEMKGWTTSDISVQPAVRVSQILVDAAGQRLAGQPDPPAFSTLQLGDAVAFDNEGRHRWDAGIGVPVRRASDVKFDKTTGLATPAKIDKTSALAMVSIYPYPVDLKSDESQVIPHLVLGVDISSTPLNEIFAGVGWGPVFANFYIGGSSVKLQEPAADGRKREWQMTGGVLLKARGILEKLK